VTQVSARKQDKSWFTFKPFRWSKYISPKRRIIIPDDITVRNHSYLIPKLSRAVICPNSIQLFVFVMEMEGFL
jgi:hypothetical protein